MPHIGLTTLTAEYPPQNQYGVLKYNYEGLALRLTWKKFKDFKTNIAFYLQLH